MATNAELSYNTTRSFPAKKDSVSVGITVPVVYKNENDASALL
jgi:hypothetical protein